MVEHQDFLLSTEGDDRIIQALDFRVDIVERLPDSNGWYIGDSKYDIPHGDCVDLSDDGARFLWRIEKRVGLLSRGDFFLGFYRGHFVYLLVVLPSLRLGVVVQHPASSLRCSIRMPQIITANRLGCSGRTANQ